MRIVEIAGTDVRTTALGFGTAALLGRLDANVSLRLLERAYDEGIRHFDTAPLYGFGEAEALLGRFAASKPDVTIATKFGLSVGGGGGAGPLRKIANAARPLLNAVPQLRARLGSLARKATLSQSNFTAAAAKASLERSLRELARDRVDVLLLHECRIPDLADPELLEFLRSSVARGDVRAFGLGTDAETTAYAAANAPEFSSVLQFENNAANRTIETLASASKPRTYITHSPFGGVGRTLPGDPAQRLAYALRANPNGVVLFSTSGEERIAANVRAALEFA